MLELNFSIDNENDLVNAFRLRDQKKLMLPKDLPYPFNVRSYFTWQDPNGIYTYLVFKMPNWCHAYGSSDEIGMLSLNLNANVSVGYLICQDLRCIEKIEEASARAGKSPEKLIDQLYQRMAHLFENVQQAKLD